MTMKTTVLTMLLSLLTLASYAQEKEQKEKYEYAVLYYSKEDGFMSTTYLVARTGEKTLKTKLSGEEYTTLVIVLNRMGEQGWEVISRIDRFGTTLVLKRRKK